MRPVDKIAAYAKTMAAQALEDLESYLNAAIEHVVYETIDEHDLHDKLSVNIVGDYIRYEYMGRAVYHFSNGDPESDYFATDHAQSSPITELDCFVPAAQAIRDILGNCLPKKNDFRFEHDANPTG